MTDVLKVNTAELHYQLRQADDTLHQLQDSAHNVGNIATSFETALKGEAGDAVREALHSFTQAMTSLCIAHQGITEKLQAAVAAYEGTDAHASEGLTSAMNI
jgi:uncharacterized protein YukE